MEDISIHALREEGDSATTMCRTGSGYFYPRPPRGGRRWDREGLSTRNLISIHALREEGDRPAWMLGVPGMRFLSTPSARRATIRLDVQRQGERQISIHALREEGDMLFSAVGFGGCGFLSTPSARRATARRVWPSAARNFYPRPPRGGRHFPVFGCKWIPDFYPRPPRGGRPTPAPMSRTTGNFYPRPPRGGRQQKRRKTSPLLFHYKTICTDLEELFQKHPKKEPRSAQNALKT